MAWPGLVVLGPGAYDLSTCAPSGVERAMFSICRQPASVLSKVSTLPYLELLTVVFPFPIPLRCKTSHIGFRVCLRSYLK